MEAQDRAQRAAIPKGVKMATALVGAAFAWAWMLAALFVGQERAMGDVSQSCMLGGAALTLAAFAALDLAGRRPPDFGRTAMRVFASAVSLVAIVFILTPVGERVPVAAVDVAWAVYGVVGACAIRRSFRLLSFLAGCLDGRRILRVACGVLALATVLALMAARMSVSDGAVFMLTSATVGVWLLPRERRDDRGADDAGTCGSHGATRAERDRRLTLTRLLPFAFTFIVMGFTCGFHTSVGRVLYSGESHFGNVFFVLLGACWLCALIGKRSRHRGSGMPAISLQAPFACACVAFVPLLFLDDRPDDMVWEIFQDTLVFLSTCALLASISMLASADGARGRRDRELETAAGWTPYCAVGVAMFALGLFAGWISGQAAYDAGGADGLAFRLSVTLCIALLVTSVLVTSNLMAQGVSGARGAVEGGFDGTFTEGMDDDMGAPGAIPVVAHTVDGSAVFDSMNAADRAEANGNDPADAGPRPTTGTAANPERAAGESATAASRSAIDEVCARYGLSERERVLLGLLTEGLNAQQAADRLTVSRNTVKSHMAHIYTKTGVHTRSELEELIENCR